MRDDSQSPAEERYRRLLDAAPDALLVVAANGRIEFANAQTYRIFGYERDELVGQSFDLLIPERFRAVHEDHARRFRAHPNTRPMGTGIDLRGRHRDGTEIPVEVSLSAVHSNDGTSVFAAIRDVTERHRAEARAKLNADRLASAVETIEDAFALFDSNDRLVLCNSVYRHLLSEVGGPVVGKSYEDLLDVWMRDLTFASDAERARFREQRLAGRRDPKGAFEARTRDGRTLRVMDRRTVEGGIVKTIWDLTDDVRLAEEVREARAVAEAASAAKSEFLASMSHELRTPLNAILGFAQLLERDRRDPLSSRHKERAVQIMRGGEHLLHLIDDILDLSRIEAGNLPLSREPVAVEDVLDQVRRTLEPVAARTTVELTFSPLPEGLPRVTADRTRFSQIVMNLGSNAIKYNRPTGTVTLRASAEAPGRVRITVADTGIGIPESKQSKLFQPFQRAGQETGPIEGTGIGLVISRRLAELMDGQIGFRSTAGVGSEFWLDLPVEVASGRQTPVAQAMARTATALDAHAGRLILYVEDNPANIVFMRDVVQDFDGLEFATVPTAEMGIALARSRNPDIVIMDINLPGMSGLEALSVLRSTAETAAIPVIALTAAASERDRQRGADAGFFRYLTKPVKLDELTSALEAVFSSRL